MRIALHGPMYSGKTTLSRQLVSAYGFTLVNYTDYLKELLAQALSALPHQWHSVEMMKENKKKYRPLLQDLGTFLDFDGGAYVEQCLFEQAGYLQVGDQQPQLIADNIVFDNVRTQAQLEVLKKYGFTLVRLYLPTDEQVRRASAAGVSIPELVNLQQHPCEAPLNFQTPSFTVNVSEFQPAQLADFVVRSMEVAA